jgi:hypothetical protein
MVAGDEVDGRDCSASTPHLTTIGFRKPMRSMLCIRPSTAAGAVSRLAPRPLNKRSGLPLHLGSETGDLTATAGSGRRPRLSRRTHSAPVAFDQHDPAHGP